jgi:hypothetical protein
MRIADNPFMDEGVRNYFTQPGILRSYLALIGMNGLVLLLWWPRATFEAVLRSGNSPDTFTVVAIVLYFCLAYLGARYGSEGFSPETQVQLREYVTLTPVPLASIIAGKVVFALLHTVFLLALGAPFLLASLAVSGAGPSSSLPALLVIGAATLAVRMYGLFVLILLGERQPFRTAALMLGIVLFLAVTAALAPAANPVVALLSIAPREVVPTLPVPLLSGSIPFFSLSVIIDLLAALLLGGGALACLGVMRSRARKKKNETQRH